MSERIRRIAAEIGQAFLAILLVFALVGAYVLYQRHCLAQFCSGLSASATPESVLAMAQQLGLPAHDYSGQPRRVLVFNHQAPFFRFACTVEFAAPGKLTAYVSGAD